MALSVAVFPSGELAIQSSNGLRCRLLALLNQVDTCMTVRPDSVASCCFSSVVGYCLMEWESSHFCRISTASGGWRDARPDGPCSSSVSSTLNGYSTELITGELPWLCRPPLLKLLLLPVHIPLLIWRARASLLANFRPHSLHMVDTIGFSV